MRFHGKKWPQAALNRDWHEWAWKLFHHAAFVTAPWPQTYHASNPGGRRLDHMSVTEWVDTYIPGGVASDFGALCIAATLDEYGGPGDETSALNLVYLLGQDTSTASGAQPHRAPQLGGGNEKWHIHGGNDHLITGLLARLPAGVLHLGERLVAIRPRADGYRCSFESAGTTRDVTADHVVLAMPFTLLRSVDLSRVPISPLHAKQPVFLTVTEAARRMSQSRPSVLRQIHNGQLRSLRLGRTYRIPDQHTNRILADGSCDDTYLTAAECARILRCPHRTICALAHHGHLAGRLSESHDCYQIRIAELSTAAEF